MPLNSLMFSSAILNLLLIPSVYLSSVTFEGFISKGYICVFFMSSMPLLSEQEYSYKTTLAPAVPLI